MTRWHCENCGTPDPITDNDGYTTCCNENDCDGRSRYRFGTPTDNVVACCWAKADDAFAAAGRTVPDGSSRLRDATY